MRTLSSVLVLAAAAGLALSGTAAAAAPAPCNGTVQVTSVSDYQIRQAGTETIVGFDFTGLHQFCLADGTEVTGTVVGHLVQRSSANGGTLRFAEILSYGGGELAYAGQARFSGRSFQGQVETQGAGTGPLAGIHGQGRFWPTSPTSFADAIDYVYGK